MAKAAKLLEKARNQPGGSSLDDFEALLSRPGPWVKRGQQGSLRLGTAPRRATGSRESSAKNGKAKRYQVKQFLDAIETELVIWNTIWSDGFDGESLTSTRRTTGFCRTFVELPNISAFANTPEQALAEPDSAWRLVKRGFAEDGEPVPVLENYSGQFNMRIDKCTGRCRGAGLTARALLPEACEVFAQKARPGHRR